jgi:perosamine synthetase
MQPFEQLEKEFAEWACVENPVACASGTAALHLALESLGMPLGSEVIVPEFTMVACARAVSAAGLVPVFVDCGDDLLMDAAKVEAAITPQTCAIMPVHIYGRICAMNALTQLASRHGLRMVEDLSEVHGIPPHPHTDAACWSFYQNKIICGEEGGLVAFKDPQHATTARELRTLGFTTRHDFFHRARGWNHRMSNAHATLILNSLHAADKHLERRREVEEWYNEQVPAYFQIPFWRDAVWVYDLRVPAAHNMEALVATLNQQGIEARMGFKPMSQQPEYLGAYEHLNAYNMSKRVFYLPVSPMFARDTVCRITGCLKELL